jgi:hypothetical protein
MTLTVTEAGLFLADPAAYTDEGRLHQALVLPRVLIEAAQYPPHFDDTVQSIVRTRFGTMRAVIEAAAGRGELPARIPAEEVAPMRA